MHMHRHLIIRKGLAVILRDRQLSMGLCINSAGNIQALRVILIQRNCRRKGLADIFHGHMINQAVPSPVSCVKAIGSAYIRAQIQHAVHPRVK